MKIYNSCPVQKAARGVWGYFCLKNGQSPKRLWKMPQCFKKNNEEKGIYGKWVADFGTFRDTFDPAKPAAVSVKNVYSFLTEQLLIENSAERILNADK
jgi:hypothetical protein